MRLSVSTPRLALALALCSFLLYNVNGREAYPTGDSRPTGLLPFSLFYERDLDLNEYHPPEAGIRGPIRSEDGRIVSNYSPLPALLSLPLYLPALPLRGEINGDILRWEPFFSKLAGSFWAALAVACFFLAALQVASRRAALLTALVLAFASPFWVSASQTLGQHGLTVLLGSLTLLSLARLERMGSARWALAAGVFCALAMGIRLVNAAIFFAVLGYLALYRKRDAALFAAPVIVLGAPLALSLLAILGGASGGLQAFAFVDRIRSQFKGDPGAGLPGLLLSPGEGLFVWAPVLVLLLLPLASSVAGGPKGRGPGPRTPARASVTRRGRRPKGESAADEDAAGRGGTGGAPAGSASASGGGGSWLPRRLLLFCLCTALLLLSVYSSYVSWWGGRTYGPRYVTDLLPFLLLPAAAGLERWLPRRWFWGAFVVLFLWSSYIQLLGAFRFPCPGRDVPTRARPDEERIWTWADADFVLCSESPRRPPQDFRSARRLLGLTFR